MPCFSAVFWQQKWFVSFLWGNHAHNFSTWVIKTGAYTVPVSGGDRETLSEKNCDLGLG